MEVAKEHLAKPMSNVAVCHGQLLRKRDFVQRIKNLGNVGEVLMGHVSPVIGVHTGPGTLGFVVYQTD